VHYKPYDGVTLTARGRSVAEDIARRHTVLRRFFVEVLAVDEGTADKGACTMEHAVPRAIVDRFIEFLRFLDTPPQDGQPWVRLFERFCSSGHGHMDVSADAESPGSQ
jgi:DtxR family Mn-dependent transcriptional regulator